MTSRATECSRPFSEFALERLDEAADASEIRRRHAEHFLTFSLEAQPELVRRDQRQWLDRLEADHDNLRAALSRLLDDEPERALTLAHALALFWYTRGHVREGRDWIVEALEHASPAASATRGGALDWAGYLSIELGEDGRVFIERAVACAREANAGGPLALALSHLPISFDSDRIDEGIAILEDALAIAEQAGDPFVLGTVLNNLGVQMSEHGDTERARELYEESYRIRAEMGDVSRMSLSLVNLSDNTFAAGNVSGARDYATQALALAREVGDRRHISGATDELAWLALAEGDIGEARKLFNEALTLELRIANLSQARNTLYGLAAVAAASGDANSAARLAAAAKPDVHGYQFLGPAVTPAFERHLAAARAQTDPDRWEEAWAAGAALTIEQAAAEILQT